MRIISGTHRGRVIHPPHNLRARPTTDFAKESLFNMLNNAIALEDIDVLDLFSGTGSISYEFASRGAASVTSVEINAIHHRYIQATADGFGFKNFYAVKANAFLYVKRCPKQFDLVFADPPYDIEGSESLPDLILDNNILRTGGVLIMEHSDNIDFSNHPKFTQKRAYGSVNFSLFQA